jgi:alkylation response protein AidB-like acyl-CoA dehydrogenase
MIERTLFTEDHHQFRDTVRRFMDNEVVPFHEAWEEQGYVDREIWRKAGEAGFLCPTMPEEYGGVGVDKLFSVVLIEEQSRVNATGLGFALHSEIVAPYLLHYGSEFLKQKYLPKMATGEMIGAIAMSEPAAGSDLQGIRATAVKHSGPSGDGTDDYYLLNGSKTFITNGWHCDLVVVVAKTDTTLGAKGISLLVVDTSMAGFTKGKRLKKVGLKAQDTSELFFDNVKVPAENLLGAEGSGFVSLMQELPWERMQIAIMSIASAEAALQWTLAYTRERKAFGQEVFKFQNTRFTLAELATEIQIGRVFVDRCTELLLEKKLDTATASMAKGWLPASSCTAAMASCGNTRLPAPGPMPAYSASTVARMRS